MNRQPATRLETIFRSATLCRTLGYLVLLPETAEAKIEDLVEAAEVTRPAVLDALMTLQDAGLLGTRRDGRRILYRFERDHHLAQPLLSLFEMAGTFERFGGQGPAQVESATDTPVDGSVRVEDVGTIR